MSTSRMRWRDVAGRIHWRMRRAGEALAWPEFVAVAAIVFWLGVAFWVNRPLRQEVEALQANVNALGADRAAPVLAPSLPGHGSAGFVTAFMAFLPTIDLREQQLQTLHSLANESGVELSRVAYGHSDLEHLPGRRMTMQLSLAAEYGPYRKFLHNLLVAMPNLSIDRVTLERAPGQASQLNVQIEVSLHYRSPLAGNVQ